jgi:hypothetical protein
MTGEEIRTEHLKIEGMLTLQAGDIERDRACKISYRQ